MIGIFDSGIGGLTVVSTILKQLKGYDLIYFGDTARTPYGNKSPATVINYALEDTAFLLDQGARIIVMACNSASSVAVDAVRDRFKIPVFEVITPAVNLALTLTKKNAIGVIGTRATINSGIYEAKLKSGNAEIKVYSNPCPLLVPLVEEGWFKRPETRMIVKKYLHPLKTRQIDTLILGCTHYPILKTIIQRKIGQRVTIIDSSETVAKEIEIFLTQNPKIKDNLTQNDQHRFFVSDVTSQFEKTAKILLKCNLKLQQAQF